MTSPTTCAVVPGWIRLNGTIGSCVNTSSSETAITISGVTSGIGISAFAAPEPRPRQRVKPRASITPSGVAITMSRPARIEAVNQRVRVGGSWKIDWVGSLHHQRKENPCQTLRELPSLKENRIAT